MNDWMNDLISQCLVDIPRGKYRDRTEKELRDHMRTLYLSLTEGGMNPAQARRETLRVMGEPNKLKEEYRVAWQQSLPGQMDYRLRTWAWGWVVMSGAHLLVRSVIGFVWSMVISLPGDSREPWVRMIRGIAINLSNSYLWLLIPFVPALIVGAYYLSCKFQASRHPVWQISVGLSFHWAFISVIHVWLEALDDHMTFWARFNGYFSHNATYYSLTFAFCILLGVVFGHMSVEMKRAAVV